MCSRNPSAPEAEAEGSSVQDHQELGSMLNLRGVAVVLVISNPFPGELKSLYDSALFG